MGKRKQKGGVEKERKKKSKDSRWQLRGGTPLQTEAQTENGKKNAVIMNKGKRHNIWRP